MNLVMRHPEGTHQPYEVCVYFNFHMSAAMRTYKFTRVFPHSIHAQFEPDTRSKPGSALRQQWTFRFFKIRYGW